MAAGSGARAALNDNTVAGYSHPEMDAPTLTPPAPGLAPPVAPTPTSPSWNWRQRTAARAVGGSLHRPALAVLLLVTFLLRLWGIKQGLPYSYNVDEATHFVPRAIALFSHDLNPHYFLNPPAYSYLLHIVFELWFGSSDAVSRAYATDPTSVFVLARVVAAILGTISVWLTYLAGARFFNRNVGLLAAAILAFAFLPIFYSHLALNDVPTLAPVSLSLYGIAGVMRYGRMRDYAIAGVGIGLAAATKYTGGITMLCLLDGVRHRRLRGLDVAEGGRPAVRAGARDRRCSRSWSPTRTRCSTSRRSRPACTRRRRWRRGRTRSSSAHGPAAASPTTCGRSPGAWAGARRWPRSAARSC